MIPTVTSFGIAADGREIASFDAAPALRRPDAVEVVELRGAYTLRIPAVKDAALQLALSRARDRHSTASSMELWLWHEAVLTGDVVAARKSCSLVLYDQARAPVARYVMQSCWPSKIDTGPAVGAIGAIGARRGLRETVIFTCERIRRVG